jgi:hypothetical protein
LREEEEEDTSLLANLAQDMSGTQRDTKSKE